MAIPYMFNILCWKTVNWDILASAKFVEMNPSTLIPEFI